MNLDPISNVRGLPERETDLLNKLLEVWREKHTGNRAKIMFYEMENKVRDLGIAIPDPLKNMSLVVGWPAKAVDCLAIRSQFDGFTFSDKSDRGLYDILEQNQIQLLYRQAVTDELINSCSFITVSKGGENEPDIVLNVYSAVDAAGIWDRRRKRIRAGLTVVDVKSEVEGGEEEPVWVNLYTDTDVWELKKDVNGWTSKRNPHKMGRPLIEPMAYKANTTYRPFGRSRITRAVRCITDAALRANLREEVAAEFSTAIQKYILGVEDDFFENNDKLDAYIGNVLALTPNNDGEIPKVGQFSQTGIQPQIESIRTLAARFAGETSIPVTELGIIHENPASYEALITMYSSLIIECEDLNTRNGEALKVIGKLMLATLENKSYWDLNSVERSVKCNWRDPSLMSSAARMDMVSKMTSIWPWMAESEETLALAGIDEDKRIRLMADKEAFEQRQIELARQMQQAQQPEQQAELQLDQSQERKKPVRPPRAPSAPTQER